MPRIEANNNCQELKPTIIAKYLEKYKTFLKENMVRSLDNEYGNNEGKLIIEIQKNFPIKTMAKTYGTYKESDYLINLTYESYDKLIKIKIPI